MLTPELPNVFACPREMGAGPSPHAQLGVRFRLPTHGSKKKNVLELLLFQFADFSVRNGRRQLLGQNGMFVCMFGCNDNDELDIVEITRFQVPLITSNFFGK